jgi:hypothetical protein
MPLPLVENEEPIRSGFPDQVANLGAGQELPAGGRKSAFVVEAGDAKFMGVHVCLLVG